ncbi:hypothetical protein SEA_SHROOMS_78 [Arthrobacter phage Shrooms]|nr:hypothetical protein SEA_SHROOMS_78 [Arthrobacter phage Shrooms]
MTCSNSLLYARMTGQPPRQATKSGADMFSITITTAGPREIKATVTRPLTSRLSRERVRGLIMQLAAGELGKETKDMWPMGFSPDMESGWTSVDAGGDSQGVRTIFYTIKPETGVQRQQRLHERGGMVTNADGSMGFYMPGQVPAPVTVPVKVKRQK